MFVTSNKVFHPPVIHIVFVIRTTRFLILTCAYRRTGWKTLS